MPLIPCSRREPTPNRLDERGERLGRLHDHVLTGVQLGHRLERRPHAREERLRGIGHRGAGGPPPQPLAEGPVVARRLDKQEWPRIMAGELSDRRRRFRPRKVASRMTPRPELSTTVARRNISSKVRREKSAV